MKKRGSGTKPMQTRKSAANRSRNSRFVSKNVEEEYQ